MTTAPVWITPVGFVGTATELVPTSISLSALGTSINFRKISGNLPDGLELTSSGTITGIPSAVLDTIRSKFVVRAENSSGVADRTFTIDVAGPDSPIWSTPEGYLPVGINGESYAFNNQWVEYTVAAQPVEAPTTTKITYSLTSGELPPGLIIYSNGVISGFIKDNLVPDGNISSTGGYDTEAYDRYNYDHAISFVSTSTTKIVPGIPKIYKFKLAAFDGIKTSTAIYKIVVTSADILNYNKATMPYGVTVPPIPGDKIYVEYPQWIDGHDLGSVRAENNQIIPVKAYDLNPLIGTLTYTIINGPSIYSQLPNGLELDQTQGYLYGFIPYQPAYSRDYSLTIAASKTVIHPNLTSSTTVLSLNTFTLTVKGEVESTISWVSTGALGSIEEGFVSDLSIEAKQLNSNYSIKYALVDGNLPNGLSLQSNGTITGRPDYGSMGAYNFSVRASDVYELSAIEQQFNLQVTRINPKEYTNIYVRPYFTKDKRELFRNFITNSFTFDPALIYRYHDSNFGVQTNLRIILEFGIERVNLGLIAAAIREGFYRRKFYFGDIKRAIAVKTDPVTNTSTSIYEVIYVDIVDDLINNNGDSIEHLFYTNFHNKYEIYYPGSISNMREELRLLALEDDTYIGVNDDYLPLFMQTPQKGYYNPPGYMRVIPLCYALPGQGNKILSRIKLSGFDFKQLNFEIDRLIVQSSIDSASDKYLIFDRQALGDLINTDYNLYGPDWIDPIEYRVRVDNKENDSLTRK